MKFSTGNFTVTQDVEENIRHKIEASHAGEMGRGFSVIADEIRSLAEHTAENTKSITTIIKEITRRIEESVELANNSGQSLSKRKHFFKWILRFSCKPFTSLV